MRFAPRFDRTHRHERKLKLARAKRSQHRKALIEALETRQLLATLTIDVTTPLDTFNGVFNASIDGNGNIVYDTRPNPNQDGLISLREAIYLSNAAPNGTDVTINLQPNTVYELSRVRGTIQGRDSETTPQDQFFNDLDVRHRSLTIQGNGATIDANRIDRVFEVITFQKFELHDLTITGGEAKTRVSGGERHVGGAIWVGPGATTGPLSSPILLDHVHIVDNLAGTTTRAANDQAGSTARGAGLYINNQDGTVTIRNSVIENNVAEGSPGGHADSNDDGSQGGGGFGGGIYLSEGAMVIEDSTIVSNQVIGGNGGDADDTDAVGGAGGDQHGAGIYVSLGQLTVRRTEFTDNLAGASGARRPRGSNATNGGLGDIAGAGSHAAGGAIYVDSPAFGNPTVTIEDSNFSNNIAQGGIGGGDDRRGGQGGDGIGGAISASYATIDLGVVSTTPMPNLILDRNSFDANQAIGGLGGPGEYGGNGGQGGGGAVYLEEDDRLPFTWTKNVFVGNTAQGGEGRQANWERSGDGGLARGGAMLFRFGKVSGANARNTNFEGTFVDHLFYGNEALGGQGGVGPTGIDNDGTTGGPRHAGDEAAGGDGGQGLGGAVYSLTNTLTFISPRFNANTAIGGDGGWSAIREVGSGGEGSGGAFYGFGGYLKIDGQSGSLDPDEDLPEFGMNQAVGGIAGYKNESGGIIIRLGGDEPLDLFTPGVGGNAYGGAIYTGTGNLLLNDVDLTQNQVQSGAGTDASGDTYVARMNGGNDGEARGGAIYTAANLELHRALMIYNFAFAGMHDHELGIYGGGRNGAGDFDDFNRRQGTRGGAGGGASGGALFVREGSVDISDSLITSNEVTASDGGHANYGISTSLGNGSVASGGDGGAALGGGIDIITDQFAPRPVSIVHTEISGNRAAGGKGGYGSVYFGRGGVGGYAAGGGLSIRTEDPNAPILFTSSVTLDGIVLGNNAVAGGDGGHAFSGSETLAGGVGGDGGAAIGGSLFLDGVTANLRNSSVLSSIASGGWGGNGGDGFHGGDGGAAGAKSDLTESGKPTFQPGAFGGGVALVSGSLNIEFSTVFGNLALAGYGGLGGNAMSSVGRGGNSGRGGLANGGGVYSGPGRGLLQPTNLQVDSSTIANNAAESGGRGQAGYGGKTLTTNARHPLRAERIVTEGTNFAWGSRSIFNSTVEGGDGNAEQASFFAMPGTMQPVYENEAARTLVSGESYSDSDVTNRSPINLAGHALAASNAIYWRAVTQIVTLRLRATKTIDAVGQPASETAIQLSNAFTKAVPKASSQLKSMVSKSVASIGRRAAVKVATKAAVKIATTTARVVRFAVGMALKMIPVVGPALDIGFEVGSLVVEAFVRGNGNPLDGLKKMAEDNRVDQETWDLLVESRSPTILLFIPPCGETGFPWEDETGSCEPEPPPQPPSGNVEDGRDGGDYQEAGRTNGANVWLGRNTFLGLINSASLSHTIVADGKMAIRERVFTPSNLPGDDRHFMREYVTVNEKPIDVSGSTIVTSGGYNFISVATNLQFRSVGDQKGNYATPLDLKSVGYVALNGGGTPTLALRPDSPARAGGAILNQDVISQNRYAWLRGTRRDIGAWGAIAPRAPVVMDRTEQIAEDGYLAIRLRDLIELNNSSSDYSIEFLAALGTSLGGAKVFATMADAQAAIDAGQWPTSALVAGQNLLPVFDNPFPDIQNGQTQTSGFAPLVRRSVGIGVLSPEAEIDPVLLFKPNPNAYGEQVFTYTINDQIHSAATMSLTVQVASVNDKPTVVLTQPLISIPPDGVTRDYPGLFQISPGPNESDQTIDRVIYSPNVVTRFGSPYPLQATATTQGNVSIQFPAGVVGTYRHALLATDSAPSSSGPSSGLFETVSAPTAISVDNLPNRLPAGVRIPLRTIAPGSIDRPVVLEDFQDSVNLVYAPVYHGRYTYQFASGSGDADNSLFTLSSDGLALKQAANAATKSSYQVRLRSTNQIGNSIEVPLTISVNTNNHAPSDLALSSNSASETLAVGATVALLSTTDSDPLDQFTYSLIPIANSSDHTYFTIDNSSGQLKLAELLDFESQTQHVVHIRTTDLAGATLDRTFTVTVEAVNEGPVQVTLSNATILENNAISELIGTLSALDPERPGDPVQFQLADAPESDNDAFEITNNQLRAARQFNFEETPELHILVEGIDLDGKVAQFPLTISVRNKNEPGSNVQISSNVIDYRATSGIVVGTLGTDDPDVGETFTYSLVQGEFLNSNANFRIEQDRLIVNFSPFHTPPAVGIAIGRNIRVRSVSSHGDTVESDIGIYPKVNQAPAGVAIQVNGRQVTENTGPNHLVSKLKPRDDDAEDIPFTLQFVAGDGDTDNSRFTIVGDRLLLNQPVDFETTPELFLRVEATDQYGAVGAPQKLTITVTDVNEAPNNLQPTTRSIAENLPPLSAVGTFSASDPDRNDTLTFSLVSGTGDTDNAAFVIEAGILKARQSLNFEAKNSYTVRVRATDRAGLFVESPVTIQVTDVVEPGEITVTHGVGIGATSITEGGAFSFGSVAPNTPLTRAFTVTNDGDGPLTLQPITVTGNGFTLSSANFTVGQTLQRGQSASFSVTMTGTAGANLTGNVSFANNDPNENPFNFTLSGSIQGFTSLIDDGAPGFTTQGTWTTIANFGYEKDARIASGAANQQAEWNFSQLTPGIYTVFATWLPGSDRATNAPYQVRNGSGQVLLNTLVDQTRTPAGGPTIDGRPFASLGSVSLGDTSLISRLSKANTTGHIIADAVALLRTGDLPQAPEIDVASGTSLGQAAAINFGSTTVGAPAITRTFTITNEGNANLLLQPLAISGTGFSLASPNFSVGQIVAPSASVTFTIQLGTSAVGSHSTTVTIGSNDADEGSFRLNLSGVVEAVQAFRAIINDGATGFASSGPWQNVAGYGFGGQAKILTGTSDHFATWTFSGLTPGQYSIATTWLAGSDRASNAIYRFLDGSTNQPLGEATVNQRSNPSGAAAEGGRPFSNLGTVLLNGTELVVRLAKTGTNGHLIADAVRIERVGGAVTSPEIEVLDGANNLALGGTLAFGGWNQGDNAPVKTVTVRNTGTGPLTLQPITVTGTAFTLASPNFTAGQVLAAGATTSFSIRMSTNAVGPQSGTVTFGNSDADENPYSLSLNGQINVVTTTGSRIVDDGDAAFSLVGKWNTVSGYGYGTDARAATGSDGNNRAVWTFTGLTAGTYAIDATWLFGTDRASNAAYDFRNGLGGLAGATIGSATVNQRVAPAGATSEGNRPFQTIGTVTVTGDTLVVELSNLGANGAVIADGMRIRKLS